MADDASHHVTESDAFTLQLERDPALRATVVAVAVFDRAPDWDRLVDRIDRATRLAPSFREKLVSSPLRLAPPRFVPDPDFDLSWHLRRTRLPEGGGHAELLDLARTALMDAFDHDRPLWEFTLVEGLPDGRAALVLKVHHALTDGIGGVQIAAHVVDLDRDGTDMGPLPPVPEIRSAWPFEAVAEALGYDLRRAVEAGQQALRAAPGAAIDAVRHPIGTTGRALEDIRSVLRMVRPVTDTQSPIMRDRKLVRHFETMDVSLAHLRAAAAAAGGTINDGFVAGIAGGMRLYHQQHCACVSQLRVTMPISVRTEGDEIGGNHVTLVRFELPVGITDPGHRIRAVHEICQAQRHEAAIDHTEAIAGVLNLLPVGVTGGMLRHVDLLASNVPGFDLQVFVAGAELEAFYPFGATLGSAANITLMSYRGTCHIGVDTDGGAVPDPDVFIASLRAGFDEVLSLAADPGPT
ncbi:MAG: wax ester/triacylglycerol synthase family O-acyltransferase [Actinobacteria bacterium]|nr:wax ester/triacylglycerol synthase family O-acyltransferase [Actinomycetota bacterium]